MPKTSEISLNISCLHKTSHICILCYCLNLELLINLRYPTMGEASLSQLRIWRHALPSMVTQVGWHEEQKMLFYSSDKNMKSKILSDTYSGWLTILNH